MTPSPSPRMRLPQLATILVSGADARSFLQGQLSFDMDRLSPQRAELACCNSAQGRVQAVLWMVQRADAIALVLPAGIVDATVARLRKYVLRAKAKIEPGADRCLVYASTDTAAGPPLQHEQQGEASRIQWPGPSPRALILAPASPAPQDDAAAQSWHLADIRAGLPQVYAATQEHFVAQMLNVDLLGGISFEKGCYTGQEIIARTHYRGAIKRRMFRFRAECPPPAAATRLLAGAAHAGDVVDSAATPEGCELLAVVTLAQLDAGLQLDGSGAKLQRLDLPYPVET